MNTATKSTKARIESIRIERTADTDADTSYYGQYTDDTCEECFVARGKHYGKQIKELTEEEREELPERGREFRYFLPAMTGEQTGNPESPRQDFARMEALNRGDWQYIGIVAKAVIVSGNGIIQTVRSGGLWGIESDSDDSHTGQVEREELAQLRTELESFGFGARAINYAFKNVTRKDC